MKIKKNVILILVIVGALIYQQYSYANTYQITDNGKTARFTLPLKANITVDSVIRDNISVTQLSSLYEILSWDQANKRFNSHEFLLRVEKDQPVPILFEIINDHYTCSYNNPDRMTILPRDISVVNSGYSYSVSWDRNNINMGNGRSVTINDNNSWLPSVNGTNRFIDLTLNIFFPDMSSYAQLMNYGGLCRGSVTILLSSNL